MIFVHLNTADEENENVLDFFGIKVDQCPTFVIFEMESSAKFLPSGDAAKDISISNMGGFVKDYFEGKIQKTVKSAELPADWDAEPVKVLVTTNFEEVAMDKTKDAFVEFYAPWCGHCKRMAPEYSVAAKELKEKGIILAKVDATVETKLRDKF